MLLPHGADRVRFPADAAFGFISRRCSVEERIELPCGSSYLKRMGSGVVLVVEARLQRGGRFRFAADATFDFGSRRCPVEEAAELILFHESCDSSCLKLMGFDSRNALLISSPLKDRGDIVLKISNPVPTSPVNSSFDLQITDISLGSSSPDFQSNILKNSENSGFNSIITHLPTEVVSTQPTVTDPIDLNLYKSPTGLKPIPSPSKSKAAGLPRTRTRAKFDVDCVTQKTKPKIQKWQEP
ncbi:hypothetical protein HNY73_020083 [Argiope bruennichi]|uniref:Uncharacterized protein n=1 Tax=Argiope bruennichi TaxID=94029 RepID=A0A8T0E724_ARGBR|nr:hypothetical protein HNY73_020083 [Argiope bruennichi]